MAINNISFEILERLLRKSSISTNDRCQIDSFVYASLADFCNDIKPNEIEKVHILEERNLYRYMNAACTVLGIYGKDAFDKLLTTSPFNRMYSELALEYRGKELQKNFIIIMIKMLLALGGNGGNQIATPIFEGEMPQKLMSFRNQTAKDWFGKLVTTKAYILANIYEKTSWEETKAHLFVSIAYQLHHSNPIKYGIDANVPMNDALMNIMRKFIDEQGGNPSVIYSNSGEVLSKVL